MDADQEILLDVGQILVDTFDAPVTVVSARMDDNDMIVGEMTSGGNVFSYSMNPRWVEIEYDDKATKGFHEYLAGYLGFNERRVDAEGVYDYMAGLYRLDAGQIKCKSGNQPCGKRCIPKGQTCRVKGGGAAVKSAGVKLKSGGALAGGIAAGVAGAALTGAAGYTAYKGRDEIKQGGKNLKEIGKDAKEKYKASDEGNKQAKLEADKQLAELNKVVDEGSAYAKESIGEMETEGFFSAKDAERVRKQLDKESGTIKSLGRITAKIQKGGSDVANFARKAKITGGAIKEGAEEIATTTGRTVKKAWSKKKKSSP